MSAIKAESETILQELCYNRVDVEYSAPDRMDSRISVEDNGRIMKYVAPKNKSMLRGIRGMGRSWKQFIMHQKQLAHINPHCPDVHDNRQRDPYLLFALDAVNRGCLELHLLPPPTHSLLHIFLCLVR